MKKFIPEHIHNAMSILHSEGFSPYLVGGCVRDYIMGAVPYDYDITVNAEPSEICAAFNKYGYITKPKGRQFGTVAVYSEGMEIEITPHRTEGNYTDSRHPDKVEFVKELKLDLIRRDFTINAMAMDIDYNITDLFGGMNDISGKTIRCIGNPEIRFKEDTLRIMRCMRFASRFGFSIDKDTRRAMDITSSGIKNISSERITSELRGILFSSYAYPIANECSNILSGIIEGFTSDIFLSENKGDFATRIFSCIRYNSIEAVLRICEKLKLQRAEADKIKAMHNLYNNVLTRNGQKVIFDSNAKKALCDYASDYVISVFDSAGSVPHSLNEFIENGVYTTHALKITGAEIIATGIFHKNETSKILKKILYAVACGKIANTPDAISEYMYNEHKSNCE